MKENSNETYISLADEIDELTKEMFIGHVPINKILDGEGAKINDMEFVYEAAIQSNLLLQSYYSRFQTCLEPSSQAGICAMLIIMLMDSNGWKYDDVENLLQTMNKILQNMIRDGSIVNKSKNVQLN